MPSGRWIRKKRKELYEMEHGNKCPWCEKPLLLEKPEGMSNTKWYANMATIDHMQAVADGGKNCIDNMVLTCDRCNTKKGSQQEKINNSIQNKIVGMFKYAGIQYKGMSLEQMIAWAQAFEIEF